MNDIHSLRKKFQVPGVSFDAGQGGLAHVVISTPDAEAHVYLLGAHLTHYQPRGEPDLLFLSKKSQFASGKAIRGGVPIIFPWFGPKSGDPDAPAHGFARTSYWEVAEVRQGTAGSIAVVFELASSQLTRALWPHDFLLRYTVTVGPSLELMLDVQNSGTIAFAYEEALHTYLAVGDVRRVQVEGLAGREFLDKTDSMRRKTQASGPITIGGETDRVYLNTPDAVGVRDPALARSLSVEKLGSGATVLWNPWIAKAKALKDFGDDEWPRMLCVETANAADNGITLPAGRSHQLRARVSSVTGEPDANRARTKQWEMTPQPTTRR